MIVLMGKGGSVLSSRAIDNESPRPARPHAPRPRSVLPSRSRPKLRLRANGSRLGAGPRNRASKTVVDDLGIPAPKPPSSSGVPPIVPEGWRVFDEYDPACGF